MSDPLKITRRGRVLEVVLDRPKANAIDRETSVRMGEVFSEFSEDPELWVAIVTGATKGIGLAIAERMVRSRIEGIRDVDTGIGLARALVHRSRGRDLGALYVLSHAERARGDEGAAADALRRAAELFMPDNPVFAMLQRRASEVGE